MTCLPSESNLAPARGVLGTPDYSARYPCPQWLQDLQGHTTEG